MIYILFIWSCEIFVSGLSIRSSIFLRGDDCIDWLLDVARFLRFMRYLDAWRLAITDAIGYHICLNRQLSVTVYGWLLIIQSFGMLPGRNDTCDKRIWSELIPWLFLISINGGLVDRWTVIGCRPESRSAFPENDLCAIQLLLDLRPEIANWGLSVSHCRAGSFCLQRFLLTSYAKRSASVFLLTD